MASKAGSASGPAVNTHVYDIPVRLVAIDIILPSKLSNQCTQTSPKRQLTITQYSVPPTSTASKYTTRFARHAGSTTLLELLRALSHHDRARNVLGNHHKANISDRLIDPTLPSRDAVHDLHDLYGTDPTKEPFLRYCK